MASPRCPPIERSRRRRAKRKSLYRVFPDAITGHRYYTPSTGRWLSRDPMGEPGFELSAGKRLRKVAGGVLRSGSFGANEQANLYAMLGNDALNSFDFLGLACGCGVDVGDALVRARQNMTDRFHNLSRKDQISACEPYILAAQGIGDLITNPSALERGSKGWDLWAMTWGWNDNMKGKNSGACPNTVTIGGRCYNAWDANYYSFGVICSLCGLGYTDIKGIVDWWKLSNPTKWLDDWQAAVTFAQYGYIGGDSGPGFVSTKQDLNKTCSPSIEKFSGDLMSTWPNASITR